MPRRGENIYKRRDGRWEARYLAKRNEDGRAVYRSVYANTYLEVKEKREIARQSVGSEEKKETGYRFSYVLDKWLAYNSGCLKKQTIAKYRHCIEKHILPELGEIAVEELCADTINQFYCHKLEHGGKDGCELSRNYVRTMSIIISSALQYAVSEGWREPLRGQILRPKIENKKIHVMSRKEQMQLENMLGNRPSGAALAVYISLHAGLRIGEICALRWNDIDFAEGLMYVNSSVVRINEEHHVILKVDAPKSETSMRVIPLSEHLLDVLKEERRHASSVYVVAGVRQKEFMNPRTLENRYKKILRQSGLEDMTFHTLRHTFATRCVESGMDTKSLSEILGHSKVNITLDTYVHSSLELKRNAVKRLDDMLFWS